MKLMNLEFSRGYSYKLGEEPPLVGKALFKDERDSDITLKLDQDQAARIMEICQESLARELKSASEAMTQSLKTSIELRKNTKIGETLPESW